MHQYRIASVIDRLMIEMIAAMQMRKKTIFCYDTSCSHSTNTVYACTTSTYYVLLKVHRNIM